jgi:hypothetical protein
MGVRGAGGGIATGLETGTCGVAGAGGTIGGSGPEAGVTTGITGAMGAETGVTTGTLGDWAIGENGAPVAGALVPPTGEIGETGASGAPVAGPTGASVVDIGEVAAALNS